MAFARLGSPGEAHAQAAVDRAAERLSLRGQNRTFAHDLGNLVVLLRGLPRRLRRLAGRAPLERTRTGRAVSGLGRLRADWAD